MATKLPKILIDMLVYIAGPDGDGLCWTITMTDEAFKKAARLEKLGLVRFVARRNRRGATDGADAVATAEGKALLKALRARKS